MTDLAKEEGPKPTGKTPETIDFKSLTGKLFPWDQRRQQPVLLNMPGSPYNYIPLFSSKRQLEEMMQGGEIPYDSIKMIDHGEEFVSGLLESGADVRQTTKLILDLRFTPEGRVRFTELFIFGED